MKTKPLCFKSEQLGKNVFRVETELVRNKDWEYWFLLTSDQHWDNPHSDHELQLKHLEEAKKRGAGIMSAGDYFCLMQGKYDKRASKSDLRPEHKGDNYFDRVVKTGANFLQPYAKQFVVIAQGNHEAAIEEKHEFNILDRFCGVLNDRTGSHIHNGGYSGYIIFRFKRKQLDKKTQSSSIVLRYEHGTGGGGSVGGNVAKSFNVSKHFPDADIILSGHNHNSFITELQRQRIDKNTGALKLDIQTHIKCPSYKDEFGIGYGGWATAKIGMPPKPKGAYWLRFYYDHKIDGVLYEIIQAK